MATNSQQKAAMASPSLVPPPPPPATVQGGPNQTRPRSRIGPEAKEGSGSVPTFKVVALGNSGCGKSVFLTVLARHLANTTPKRDFYAKISDSGQKRRLDDAHKRLTTTADWPAPTLIGEIETYRFDCLVDTPSGTETVLHIDYIDYAGELIDDQKVGSPVEDQLQSHVSDADALFCMLDGARLRSWMEGEADGHYYVEHQILRLLEIVQSSLCAVHFLVTKWDQFVDDASPVFKEDRGQLALLRAALLQRDGFNHLRAQAEHRGTRRLLPVSATGRQFASIRDGHMAKHANPLLSPEYLDVPFCAVVADFLDAVESDMTFGDRWAIRWSPHLRWFTVRILSKSVTLWLTKLTRHGVIVKVIVDAFAESLKKRVGSGAPRKAATSPTTRLVGMMDHLLADVEHELPASVLGRYRTSHAA